jgi:hypothetical protein
MQASLSSFRAALEQELVAADALGLNMLLLSAVQQHSEGRDQDKQQQHAVVRQLQQQLQSCAPLSQLWAAVMPQHEPAAIAAAAAKPTAAGATAAVHRLAALLLLQHSCRRRLTSSC